MQKQRVLSFSRTKSFEFLQVSPKTYWLTWLKGICPIPYKPQQSSWFPYQSCSLSNLAVIERLHPPGRCPPWTLSHQALLSTHKSGRLCLWKSVEVDTYHLLPALGAGLHTHCLPSPHPNLCADFHSSCSQPFSYPAVRKSSLNISQFSCLKRETIYFPDLKPSSIP